MKKKLTFGGETNPKKETVKSMEDNPTAGFADGGEVKDKASSMSDIGTLAGLRDLLRKASGQTDAAKADAIDPIVTSSTEPAKGYADGGLIPGVAGGYSGAGADNLEALLDAIKGTGSAIGNAVAPAMAPDLAQASANVASSPTAAPVVNSVLGTNVQAPPTPPPGPMPQMVDVNASVPPPSAPLDPKIMAQAAQNAQTIPSTNPSIYQGISAEDRAALMQKLLAQKASPGNLAVSGVAGLGDAISNSFGKGGQNTQGAIREAQNQNIQNQIGVVDTQRQQKLQDMQANLAQQENDPNSAYSSGMRQFYSQLTGKQFPSGISASMMKSAFPDYAKIFDSQITAATAQAGQRVEAQKAGAAEGPFKRWADQIFGNPAEEALQNTATGGKAASPASNGGWSVVK